VRASRRGRHAASRRAWILVVDPPLERPMRPSPHLRFPVAPCCGTRTQDEPTIARSPSRLSEIAAGSRSRTPPAGYRTKRLQCVMRGPSRSGTFRQGDLLRNRHRLPSTTRRSSTRGKPREFCGSSGRMIVHFRAGQSVSGHVSSFRTRGIRRALSRQDPDRDPW
jgi:hypothetical protein